MCALPQKADMRSAMHNPRRFIGPHCQECKAAAPYPLDLPFNAPPRGTSTRIRQRTKAA